MKYYYDAITIILIILLIFLLGCTSTAPPTSQISISPSAQPVKPQPTSESTLSTIKPADVVLQLSDLPNGFIIKESWERTRSDLSQSALDSGWKKGYHVMFGRENESTSLVEYLITQDIDIYPIEKVNQAQAEGNKEMLQRGKIDVYEVVQLSNPKIGDASQAYAVKFLRKSKKINSDILFIQFVKKDVYEQIVMICPSAGYSTDYESLKEIAKTAAENIK